MAWRLSFLIGSSPLFRGKSNYRWVEALAPWFTLPDLVMGGPGALRDAGEASKLAGRFTGATDAARSRSLRAGQELRATLAEPDRDLQAIKAAQIEAQRRARDFRRLEAYAKRANADLLARRNAVVSTTAGVWAAHEYKKDPPQLAQAAAAKAQGEADDLYTRAERLLGVSAGSAARPGSAAHLLTPSKPAAGAARTELKLATIVTKRPGGGSMRQANAAADRPPLSAPMGALVAVGLLYVFWGGALPLAAVAADGLSPGDGDPVMSIFLPLLAVSAGPLLAVIWGLRQGSRWSLWLLRVMAGLAAVSVAVDVIIGLLLTFAVVGRSRHDVLNGEFLLVGSAILAVPGAFLLRSIVRTRWLDPRSSPEDWEPPVNRAARRGV